MSISAVVFDRDGVLTSFDWTRAEEDVRRITGLPLEEIERRWGGWLNGLTIDDAFVETQPISEFLSSLARELELGSKARDELVRLDYMAFAQGYPDARPALEEARRRGLKVGVLKQQPVGQRPQPPSVRRSARPRRRRAEFADDRSCQA